MSDEQTEALTTQRNTDADDSAAGQTFAPTASATDDMVHTNIGEHEAPGASALTTAAAASVAPTPDPEEINPYIGVVHTPEPIKAPSVIHALGDAHPGEANPALDQEQLDGVEAPKDTAALLYEREEAEENLLAEGPALQPGVVEGHQAYQDQGYPAEGALDGTGADGDRDADQNHLEAEQTNVEINTYLGGSSQFDPTLTRIDSKEESNNLFVERAASKTGLPVERSTYEREEMSHPTEPNDVGATGGMLSVPPQNDTSETANVLAVFSNVDDAQEAVRGLREIGIAAEDISILAHGDNADQAPAETPHVEPAGEETYRDASTALPNDEDLATTVADQAGTTATPDAGSAATLTASDRGGLARDEGLITRVDAPADPDIYSDFADSDADHRTLAGEGAAQTGEPNPDTNLASYSNQIDDVPVTHIDAGRGAAIGGAFGGVAGLLAGFGALFIPGIGPIIAAGPIVGAITGLIAGSATGGIVGALLAAGVPKEHAQDYAKRLANGGVLVSVQTDIINRTAVRNLLHEYGAELIH